MTNRTITQDCSLFRAGLLVMRFLSMTTGTEFQSQTCTETCSGPTDYFSSRLVSSSSPYYSPCLSHMVG